eukprot:CAMPEP_0177555512 /NCGR_PEP_ID=MMETSP0369-20130122/68570_1 /TAXON_ID=447022 ORGANISM="Scrippsiella hangoei-like, Strain SHHI-4" /NCGR_SAMPLE_ID=MMETSP0369 /ASSEMBLY_ACC=CAM_ASM_000364 /LENGTH=68 /DNA_ID=CAMNT_0019041635 /DNA_START=13 /DNA_END=219 /DNA_ORIENTATION=+
MSWPFSDRKVSCDQVRLRHGVHIAVSYRMRPLSDKDADPRTTGIAHYGVMSMYQMRAAFAPPAPDFHV